MITYLKNIQKISLIFFMVTGFIHLISGSLFYGNYSSDLFGVVFKSSFLPFVICGLIYGGSSLKINIFNYSGEDSSILNKIFLIIGFSIILILTIIFFLLPNS